MEHVHWASKNPLAMVGMARISGVRVAPSPPWLVEMLRTPPMEVCDPAAWDEAIRAMIRAGGFKPSGRNRPAHEFLARSGAVSISNVVDANNAFSLRHRLPASAVDTGVFKGACVVREGRAGEWYVFNRSGQSLDLEGLLVLCDAQDTPVASPVKDSLAAHVSGATEDVVLCIYGTKALLTPGQVTRLLEEFCALVREAAGGRQAGIWVVPGTQGL